MCHVTGSSCNSLYVGWEDTMAHAALPRMANRFCDAGGKPHLSREMRLLVTIKLVSAFTKSFA